MIKCFTAPPSNDSVDPWHYTGSQTFHRSVPGQTFIEFGQAHLPQLNAVVKVGPTGYPAYGSYFKEQWGWCLDEVGRIFVVTPNYYLFQRMLQGHVMMMSQRDRDSLMPVSDELLAQLQQDWSSK